MRWVLIATVLVSAFPVRAETKPTYTDLAFYTNDAPSFAGLLSAGASTVSALVALIAVGVSLYIASNARRTAESANETSKRALDAAKDNTKTLYRIERPYITGGGGWVPTMVNPVKQQILAGKFVVDVKNNGKTPALLTHFFVDFAMRASLPTWPDYQTKYIHYDWLGANEPKHGIKEIDIPVVNGVWPDVIYGAFHYKDFDRNDHEFRFILKIGLTTTHPDIALDVPGAYSHWS
jgi:hypothetical protein